ncbi:MAG: hypothetical protein QM492_08705 [Rhodobacterales bacterium]
MDKAAFNTLGWAKLPHDPQLAAWLENTRPAANHAINAPENRTNWLRSQGTWFVGVDILHDYPPLPDTVAKAAKFATGDIVTDWGLGQISVCTKGYPLQDAAETPAMFSYRKRRDYAHLDGLKAVGPARRRKMQEFHGFILGIPLNLTPPKAAPFVLWEGSHLIFRDMLAKAYAGHPPETWAGIDLTEIYQKTRTQIFKCCKRIELHARPGEAYIAHRFALHGMAAWDATLDGPDEGREIVYFRPYWQGDMQAWLEI